MRARGGAERRAPPADRPARAGWAALRQFLFRAILFRDIPIRGERWSSGVRGPQSDRLAGAACWPPSPVPEFGLGLVRPPRRRIRWCGRRRRASAARYGVDFDTTPIEAALIGGACSRSRGRGGVYLIGANFSRARARRSRATRSASRQTRSSRLGGASPISFSSNSFSRYSDSGANDGARAFGARNRTNSLAPPAGRRRQFLSLGWGWCGRRGAGFDGVVGGVGRGTGYIAQQAALKDQQIRGAAFTLLARISRVRARGGAERRAPPADRPARAGWAALRQFLFRAILFRDIPIERMVVRGPHRTNSLAPPAGRRRQFLSLGWGWCGRRGAG